MTGNIPSGPKDCTTVGEIIDLWTHKTQTRPAKNNGDDEARQSHLLMETECEDVMLAAISYYGPVLWRGQIWWGRMPPRLLRVNHTGFGGFAGELPWPPRKTPLPDLEADKVEVPIKEVGFISQLPH